MSRWSEDYSTETDYTHGYYRELSPNLQRFALLVAGFAAPPDQGAYLELGYGQGVSLAIHAAASPIQAWGTDFNSSQAVHANSLLQAAGIDAGACDDSFAEFADRRDLPEFGFIALHGIWSWVSDENRSHILSILRRSLATGGVLYISYNTLPGWGASRPLRDLLALHAETVGAESQGIAGRVDGALAFAQELADKGAAYFRTNPAAAARLKWIAQNNKTYVAHEFFNRTWDPVTFAALAKRLHEAELEFAASARVLDQMETLNLSKDAQGMLGAIGHPILRESVRDFFVNQEFRRDLFVRGPRRLPGWERQEKLATIKLVLTAPAETIPLTTKSSAGSQIDLAETIYRPILELFHKESYRPIVLAEICRRLPELSFAHVTEAASVLVGAGYACPAQSDATIEKAAPRCRALNWELLNRARSGDEIRYLASPVTGGGVLVQHVQQLFLLARANGEKTPEDWARATWRQCAILGRRMVKDGRTLETADENIAELISLARSFAASYLPLLVALGVAD